MVLNSKHQSCDGAVHSQSADEAITGMSVKLYRDMASMSVPLNLLEKRPLSGNTLEALLRLVVSDLQGM